VSSPLEQSELFPDLHLKIPPIARRIWTEALAYYKTGTLEPLTQRLLSELLQRRNPSLPGGFRTVQRAFHDHPQWLKWPILSGQRPPWEPAPTAPEGGGKVIDSEPLALRSIDLVSGDGRMVAVTVDEQGFLHLARWKDALLTLAAGLATTVVVLDGMDGHIDHVIHWCRVMGLVTGHHF